MATTGFSASNYHSIADHADLTHPNGDWSEIIILRPDSISGTYVPLSNGAGYGANTRQLYQFDDSLELVFNGTDGTLITGLSSGTWYLVVLHRSSGNMQVKMCPMGTTSVSSGGLVALAAESNSTSDTYIGRNYGTANAFDGAISDWLFIPGVSISNADMQSIATGTPIDSFSWYSDVDVWAILEDSTNTDEIGGKTITENGTLTATSDHASLVRFATGTTINGTPGEIELSGVSGQVISGRTINGTPGQIELSGVSGLVVASVIIDGIPGQIELSGVTGQVISSEGVTINGTPGTIELSGLAGQIVYERIINGTPGAIELSGVTGEVVYGFVINGTPGQIELSGVSGQVSATTIINGTPGAIQLSGVTGLVRLTILPPVPETNPGSNLYIIGNNHFDSATLAATSTATGFDKDNMQLDRKSSVWRSTDLSEQTITATWAATKALSAVAFAFSNLHIDSTVQIKLYTNSGDPTAVYDSGELNIDYAYDAPDGFSTIGLNAFAFGGGTYFSHLFSEIECEKMEVIINSSGNPDSYMEISRIIAGFALTPEYGARYGAEINHDDSTSILRTDAGDLVSNRGTVSKRINLTLGVLNAVDKQAMATITRGRGAGKPVFVSMYENSQNREERQAFMIYGVFNQLPGLNIFQKNRYSTTFSISEI